MYSFNFKTFLLQPRKINPLPVILVLVKNKWSIGCQSVINRPPLEKNKHKLTVKWIHLSNYKFPFCLTWQNAWMLTLNYQLFWKPESFHNIKMTVFQLLCLMYFSNVMANCYVRTRSLLGVPSQNKGCLVLNLVWLLPL